MLSSRHYDNGVIEVLRLHMTYYHRLSYCLTGEVDLPMNSMFVLRNAMSSLNSLKMNAKRWEFSCS